MDKSQDEVVVSLAVTLDAEHFGRNSIPLQEAIKLLHGVVRVEGIAAGAVPSVLLESEARRDERRKIGLRLQSMGYKFIYNERDEE